MKESDFIEQNKEKWKNFEENLIKKDATPREVSKLFVQITDDLSYARTFYNNRSVKLYLNGVAKLLFNDINKTKKNKWSVFSSFWKKDLPLEMYSARRPMLISFIVFWSCFALGVITSIYEPDFAETILGSGYIDMTNENIEQGDAMAVYKDEGAFGMFLRIFVNNARVDFLTFLSGIFMSIGTFFIMIFNGVMIGAFQYFFVTKGLFWESFLTIWTHGTLEISTIVISGGGGLTLGKGLLFPGTHSRFEAMKTSARSGLKIIMGVIPITFFAAFIESYLTRYTELPSFLRLAFILLSLSFVIIYFVWYPRRVFKTTSLLEEDAKEDLVYVKKTIFNPNKILSVAELFSESLRVFLKNIGRYALFLVPCSFIFAVLVATDDLGLFFTTDYYYLNYSFSDYFNYSELPASAIFLGVVFIFFLTFSTLYTQHKLISPEKNFKLKNSPFSYSVTSYLLSVPIFVGLIAIGSGWFVFLAFLLLPVFILMGVISANENISFFAAAGQTSGLLNKNWMKFIALMLAVAFLFYLFFSSANTILNTFFVKSVIVGALTSDESVSSSISTGISAFLICFTFLSCLMLISASCCVLYHTLKESHTAKDLLFRIKNISAKE
ncbi:MAG: stage II sporulation protein M [Flavobacteriales bacterium]|nr:stage II sporulation protein M [Flavobacteriales bacterium]